MLKALLKKQCYELFAILFLGAGRTKSKKKKKSNKSNIAAKIVLFGLLFGILFVGMCAWAFGMVDGLVKQNFDWIYFLIFGFMALIASIAFNAFIAYNMIFKAKDNSFLLSMPIPPKTILFSRMAVLFMNCMIVNFFVWLPAVIMYQTVKFSVVALISGILMMIIISMISLAFACLVGWFIAIISKNQITKIVLSIVGMLILIAFAFVARAFMNYLMIGLIENVHSVNDFMMSNAPFLYYFGNAATGDVTSLLILLAVGIVSFGLIYFIMSKTFMRIVTTKYSAKHKTYKATSQKANKLSKSLLNKEWLFLFKTPVYLMNAGLGVVFLIIAAIACCFFIPALSEVLPMLREVSAAGGSEYPFNILNELIPIGILTVVIFCNGFCTLSAPSISVEGKSLWILKSLPIKTYDIFMSKIKLHVYYNCVPAFLFIVVFSLICRESAINIVSMLVCTIAFNYLFAYFGLFVGILRANLLWTNITVPIKQNLAILFAMLFNIAFIAIYICGFVMITQNFTFNAASYIFGFAVLCVIGSFILDRWLRSSGTRHFAEL